MLEHRTSEFRDPTSSAHFIESEATPRNPLMIPRRYNQFAMVLRDPKMLYCILGIIIVMLAVRQSHFAIFDMTVGATASPSGLNLTPVQGQPTLIPSARVRCSHNMCNRSHTKATP